jgi:serine/threonine-protein kinase
LIPSGTTIDGRYEIVGPLGAGGMGQVYRAARPLLGDEVALKVMNAPIDSGSELRQRFLRESRACAQLRHPNIVSILDFNVGANGQPYMVMELLSGPSLRDEIELSGAMPPAAAVAILAPVAAALQMAHDRGITHRDLKPANIVSHRYDSGDRVYKIIDFGLAAVKEASDDTRLTNPDHFVGTLAYAAPEQLRGEPVDARADIYALGVIAYEMLAGRRPFDSDNRVTLVNQALTVRPVAPGQHQSGLSAAIDAVIMRALAKEPAERWQTATDFVRALQAAAGTAPAARPSAAPDDHLLSRYELGEMLGRGRMGSVVYLGVHRALGVRVAIRLLRREEQPHWEAVKARFLVEARTLQVAHPNVLQVRDYGEDDRLVFVVTDFIDGPSLRQELVRAGQMPWERARHLLGQMLAATAALNDRGGFIVGVNPDMIRLTISPDTLVLTTAGIRSVQDVLATMREQELRGEEANEQELPYIAPEVLLGRAPEPAADVFTAGVLTYQMVTAALPFRAPTLPELIGQMLQSKPAEARSLNPDVPDEVSLVLGECLIADPRQRIPSARALLARL